jgi:CSLREA domain-containing protein
VVFRDDSARSGRCLRVLAVGVAVLAALLGGSGTGHAQALALLVDDRSDAVDANPGDGVCATSANVCTLRAAVMEANAHPGSDTIAFQAPQPGVFDVFTLNRTGAGEDAADTGDLDLTDDVTIQGLGRRNTIVDGAGADRVFHLSPGGASITVRISGLTVRNGSVPSLGTGAGIDNIGATLTLTDADVTGNTGGGLGAGLLNRASAALRNVRFSSNRGIDGGGIDNQGSGVVTLEDVTISGNTVTNGGGGITNFGQLEATRTTISGNSASFGGGISNSAGTLRLENATLSGNSAATAGGGLWNGASATLRSVTLAGNSAASGGGINDPGSANLQNTIVADGAGGNCVGAVASLGHNLDTGATCNLSGPGDLSNTNPLLGPLTHGVGRTATHALRPGSPAIDAGAGCPSHDQRNVRRPQGPACDIGAHEVQTGGLAVDSTADLTDLAPGDGVCRAANSRCTLRAAVQEANALPGTDLISFAVNGVFALTLAGAGEDQAATGDLDVLDDVTLRGNGTKSTIVDAGGTALGDRILDVDPARTGVSVVASGMTLRNARPASLAEGAGIRSGTTYFGEPPRLRLTSVVVSGNTATGIAFASGGGILTYGPLDLVGVTLRSNVASVGGGLLLRNLAVASLTKVILDKNHADVEGGGITVAANAVLRITGSTLRRNSAPRGGGLINNPEASTELRTSVLLANVADASGGGAYSRGELTVSDSTFQQNLAGATNGGGISNVVGTLRVTGTTFDRNSANFLGGGVANTGQATFLNSTFSGNSAPNGGGFSSTGNATNPARAEFTYVTLADNAGAGLLNGPSGSTIMLASTIVAGSTPNCSGTVTSLGHNLDSGATCNLSGPGDLSNANPLLGPLALNGGPTRTHALAAGSPAIDAGDSARCPSTDQRGVARPQGNSCDIGAYELQ